MVWATTPERLRNLLHRTEQIPAAFAIGRQVNIPKVHKINSTYFQRLWQLVLGHNKFIPSRWAPTIVVYGVKKKL